MVIGYIEKFIGKNAKIKVLAFKDKIEWIKVSDKIIETFPPNGYVFEDSFNAKYPEYKESDVIYFSAISNYLSEDDPKKDAFKIDRVQKKLSYILHYTMKEIQNDQFSLNYSQVQEFYDFVPDKFFIKSNKGVFGPFKKNEGKIMPNLGTTVNFFESIDNFTVIYNKVSYIIEEPSNNKYEVDFSSDDQLFSWFKKFVKLNALLDRAITYDNLNQILENLLKNSADIEKSKLTRIISNFKSVHLTINEFKSLVKSSPHLTLLIEDKIKQYKSEIINEAKSEIEKDIKEFKLKSDSEKALINREIQKFKQELSGESKSERLVKIAKELNQSLSILVDYLNSKGIKIENKPTTQVDLEGQLLLYKAFGNSKSKKLSESQEELEKIQAEIEIAKNDFDVLNSKINHLTENRDTVIRDMQLFLDITRPTTVIAQAIQIPNSYIIEEILSQQSDHLSDVDFEQNFVHNLQKRNKSADIKFQELKKIISSFKCIFTSNLEVILAFIEATNNAIYTIIQIEPKWLSFKDLVDNGLKELWLSAFEKPDVLHFAILRDVNLSSPECYANPLIDLDRNLRTKLPFIEKAWPPNLRIIGTIQPVPEVGLSVLKSTFDNWGGLPTYGLQFTSVNPSEYKEQALQVTNFNTWICDRDDINNYLDQYIS